MIWLATFTYHLTPLPPSSLPLSSSSSFLSLIWSLHPLPSFLPSFLPLYLYPSLLLLLLPLFDLVTLHPLSSFFPSIFPPYLYIPPSLFLPPSSTPSILPPSSRKQVENSRREAESDGIHVPTTLQEYCQQYKPQTQSSSSYDLGDDILDGDEEYYQDSTDDMDMDSTASNSDIEEDSGTA